MNDFFEIKKEVKEALLSGFPVVALESTVISHGLPFPDNIRLAEELERIIRDEGAIPATIALMDGKIKIGLNSMELSRLADSSVKIHKTSRRDLAFVLSQKLIGATTVSATMWAANKAGIKIFATGGIGGVHRNWQETLDVSADLEELGRTPVVVVSAGIKSILDIGATLEYLETKGVPVVSYGTDYFPAFFAENSGFSSPFRLDTIEEIARMIRMHFSLQISTGVLIANPVPNEDALTEDFINSIIQNAISEQKRLNIKGKNITPFLLKKIVEKSQGKSLKANISLLKNNARLAARIAQKIR